MAKKLIGGVILKGNAELGIGFDCQICGDVQHINYISFTQIFPVCDNCKKGLHELIKNKTFLLDKR